MSNQKKQPLSPSQAKRLIAKLGKDYDNRLAKQFGVTRQHVSKLRTAAGIPTFTPRPRAKHTTFISAAVSKADVTDIKKAMIKSGVKHRSKYVRDAVRTRNKEILQG